jgi:hypothetical protein
MFGKLFFHALFSPFSARDIINTTQPDFIFSGQKLFSTFFSSKLSYFLRIAHLSVHFNSQCYINTLLLNNRNNINNSKINMLLELLTLLSIVIKLPFNFIKNFLLLTCSKKKCDQILKIIKNFIH